MSNELIIRINGTAKDFLDEIDKVKKESEDLQKVLGKVAKASAIAFAGLAASIAVITKEFAAYEKALVGVGKTTNIEGKKLEDFGKKFQKLSSQIPISTNELLGIAQAAGQLGVTGEKNLLKFTETIAKLGVATDLTGEQGAIALTRILNVTNEGIENIDKFGSVIVELGNNFAATESEIVKVTTEVARSTAVFGVSSSEAAALATALKSVGVQAQLGGSAVGRAFREIDKAIRQGGTSLQNLSKLTKISGKDLKETFEDDATAVFRAFVTGLNEIQESGGSTTEALAAFNLKGDEILKVLPVLAKNSELFADALDTANQELQENNALNAEAEKAFNTLDSEIQRTKNNFTNLATNVGAQLAPAVIELLQSINTLVTSLNNADGSTVKLLATFLKWGAIITGSVTTIATLAAGFLKLRGIIAGLSIAFKAGRLAIVGFTSAATFGLSAVVAFLPEIIAGIAAIIDKTKENEPDALVAINKEIAKLNEQLLVTQQLQGLGADRDPLAEQIKNRLELLKKERDEIVKNRNLNDENFGTGSFLVEPSATNGPIDFSLPSLPDVKVPFAGPEAEESKAEASARKAQEKRNELLEAGVQKRIEITRAENRALRELAKARAEGLTEADLEILKKKSAIDKQRAAANQIQNEEERQAALENIQLKNAAELEEISAFEADKNDIIRERREERQALEEELRQLDKQQRAALDEQDLEDFQLKIDTQAEAEQIAAQERLERQIKERNQFKQDEIKFGTEIAQVKKFLNKQEVQDFKNTSSQLAALSRSKNSTLKGIGKAAARVNAAIATAEGAIKAYTSLAGIPLVGPALGAAAAAALVAYGVEQQANISALNTGGVVPTTRGGSINRDSQLSFLTAGELVAPRGNFDEVVEGTARQRGFIPEEEAEASGDSQTEIILTLQDNLMDFVEAQINERRAVGVSSI